MRESPEQHSCASIIADIDAALAHLEAFRPEFDIAPSSAIRTSKGRRAHAKKTRSEWADVDPAIEALREVRDLALAKNAEGLLALRERARTLRVHAVSVARLALTAAMKLGNPDARTKLIALGATRLNEGDHLDALAIFYAAESREGLLKLLEVAGPRQDLDTAARIRHLLEELRRDAY